MTRNAAFASITVLLLAGCTFEPGRWFATVDPRFSAAYVARQERSAGAGWQKLSNDYEVRLTELRVSLGEMGLLASTNGSGVKRFDPAKPPPGYTLCHNGHCHHADGRLVPYAEIEAALAGSASESGLRAMMTLRVEGSLDLLAPVERTPACLPSCHLDRATVVRATATLTALSMAGEVRDGRVPARLAGEVPFVWRSSANASAVLDAPLDLPADENHAPAVALHLRLALAAALFDGLEFERVAPTAGPLDLAAAESKLLTNLREGAFLTATITRNDP